MAALKTAEVAGLALCLLTCEAPLVYLACTLTVYLNYEISAADAKATYDDCMKTKK